MVPGSGSYPFQIKETIEKRPYCTGAQGMALLYDLKQNFCDPERYQEVKAFPATLSMADRARESQKVESDDLDAMIDRARRVLREELQARVFDLRPSNSRMVLCYMSKQMPCSLYFTDVQFQLAETLYKGALRKAEEILGSTVITKEPAAPAAKKSKFDKPVGAESMLFRGAEQPDQPTPDAPELDAVADEITRWKYIAPAELAEFRCADGLLNEFKMMWKLRHRFPLHFIVFKQMACHLPHEASASHPRGARRTAGRRPRRYTRR